MPEITVYECVDCQEEYEFVEFHEKAPPQCPECGKVMTYVTTYYEPEEED